MIRTTLDYLAAFILFAMASGTMLVCVAAALFPSVVRSFL